MKHFFVFFLLLLKNYISTKMPSFSERGTCAPIFDDINYHMPVRRHAIINCRMRSMRMQTGRRNIIWEVVVSNWMKTKCMRWSLQCFELYKVLQFQRGNLPTRKTAEEEGGKEKGEGNKWRKFPPFLPSPLQIRGLCIQTFPFFCFSTVAAAIA